MLKKCFLSLILIVPIICSFIQTPVSAKNCDDEKRRYGEDSTQYLNCVNPPKKDTSTKQTDSAAFSGRKGDACLGFLGLTSWDCGVDIKDEETLKSGIWQIVANIATDITVIAAYLVLGYVIYGGYLYIFSSGDPGKVSAGKKTLTQAFIGLAIVMSAYLIMSTIRIVLLGGNKALTDCVTNECVDANTLITSTVQWFIGIAGVVSLIFVVYGGISYTTSAGEPNKLQKAKQIIMYALIGLAIVGLAEIITAFVSGMIRDANQQANSPINTSQIIAKESHEN